MSSSIRANCRKVICIGRNYADHITELKNKPPSQPFFFLKPPSSILEHPHTNSPILIPKGVNVHYEVELGLVIGRRGGSDGSNNNNGSSSSSSSSTSNTTTAAKFPLKNLTFPATEKESTSKAQSYIKSYLLAIDLTARNVQDEAKRKGLPWSIAKGFDTFLPVSRAISPDRIPDPHGVTMSLSVNGVVKQRDSTELMLFRVPRILGDVSKVMGLEEGDIVLTGTPKGVGRIVKGDKVVCTMEVDGEEIKEARIEIDVEDAPGEEEGGYVFKET